MNSLTWSSSKYSSPHKRLSNSLFPQRTHCRALISLLLCLFSFVRRVRRHFFFISARRPKFASWIMANKKILLWENVVQNSRAAVCAKDKNQIFHFSLHSRASLARSLFKSRPWESAARWLPVGRTNSCWTFMRDADAIVINAGCRHKPERRAGETAFSKAHKFQSTFPIYTPSVQSVTGRADGSASDSKIHPINLSQPE